MCVSTLLVYQLGKRYEKASLSMGEVLTGQRHHMRFKILCHLCLYLTIWRYHLFSAMRGPVPTVAGPIESMPNFSCNS